jgi:hypothetical protein
MVIVKPGGCWACVMLKHNSNAINGIVFFIRSEDRIQIFCRVAHFVQRLPWLMGMTGFYMALALFNF